MLEISSCNDHRTSAIIRMKGEGRCLTEVFVEEEVNMMFLVVDQAKGRDAAWFKTEIAHHAFGRGETEFTGTVVALCHQFGLEAMLEVVDIEVVVAMEANEVVLVALMIAKEYILAMDRSIVFPPSFCFFYCLAFWV